MTYNDLVDKFGDTAPLLNGVAVAQMALERYDDAERTLMDALAKASRPFLFDFAVVSRKSR